MTYRVLPMAAISPPHCKAEREKESQRIGRPTPSSTHFSLISLECFLFLVESRREHHVLEWHEWHETFKSSVDGISIKSYNVTFVVWEIDFELIYNREKTKKKGRECSCGSSSTRRCGHFLPAIRP